jgi:membrane-associated phospholipid phosphatase
VRAFCSILLVSLATAESAAAEPRANGPDWAFGRPEAEIALFLASAASLVTHAIPQRASDWGPFAPRARAPVFAHVSDYTGAFVGSAGTLAAGYGLELGYYAANGVRSANVRTLRTSLMELESALFTTGIQVAMKRLIGRCRPRAYREGRCVGAEHDAFPSGHTSAISSFAGVRVVTALRSSGESSQRFVALGLAEAQSVATAALRVLAGAHSWQDVLVGLALGHATGALVALAHPATPLEATTSHAASLSWQGKL